VTLNPVQVLVVGFDELNPTGEALAEMARLEAAGVVRLIDLMLVRRTEDGALETVELSDGADPAPGSIAARFFADPGSEPADEQDAWSLLDTIPVGGAAAVALIEHVWAGPLRAAIGRSGGTPLEETWLAAEDLAVLEGLLPG
jgi:hypothetical protein